MPDRLKALIEARSASWAKMNDLRAAIGDQPATAEQRDEWAKIEADLDSFSADIDAEKRNLARESAFAEVDDRIESRDLPPVKDDGVDEKRYARIYNQYLRFGLSERSSLSAEDRQILQSRFENRAQAEGTTTAGGYLVPSGYWEKLTETMKAFGGLMSEANTIRTASGQTMPWPANNDTGNSGALLSENTQISEVDVALTQQSLNAWTYTSNLILVSLQLLNDSAFDLDTWLPKKLGQRLGRAVANDLVNGNGTSRPLGIDNAPTAGVTATTGGATGAAWASNSYGKAYADLVNLVHSVDAAYRQMGNCKFIMNDLTLGIIRTITDSQNRPLWDPGRGGLTSNDPETILGYPVIIDNAMPVMAANAKSILFGDFEQGYVVRQVLDPTVMRLAERYADYLQVGYFGFQRIDGRPDDAAAVRSFVNSAT